MGTVDEAIAGLIGFAILVGIVYGIYRCCRSCCCEKEQVIVHNIYHPSPAGSAADIRHSPYGASPYASAPYASSPYAAPVYAGQPPPPPSPQQMYYR